MGYDKKSICFNPTTESFELIDCLDKEEKDLKPIYEVINITVTFDNSGWYGIAELCFEGVIAMNLRSPGGNCCREIYGGCLLVKDEYILGR